jgi:hypothetical protein
MCIFVAGMVQVWEVATGRCLKTWAVGGVVKSVAWCPNSALSLVAIAVDTKVQTNLSSTCSLQSSVADPDPHVFGPPGSGSTSRRYGSGSGSVYHHAKIVRKTLIPTIL